MARVIAVMGESGSGKTTSMRNLDPKSTFYIDCDKKGLSWKGWKNQYNLQNKNYIQNDNQLNILSCLQKINKEQLHIKTIVIDTINSIMIADEMRRAKEKGYDKWQDLAVSIYNILDYSLTMREDLSIIFIAHSQVERDDNGYMFTRIKTNGKKLDKIVLESKFTTVLNTKVLDGQHIFETKANNSTAKTPLNSFDKIEIENDIVDVLEKLSEY